MSDVASRDMRLCERFIARAVEAMEMADKIADSDFKAAVYNTANRYLKMAAEEIGKRSRSDLFSMLIYMDAYAASTFAY